MTAPTFSLSLLVLAPDRSEGPCRPRRSVGASTWRDRVRIHSAMRHNTTSDASAPSVSLTPSTPALSPPEYVTLALEAARRGFRNPLALRRFCLRLAVRLHVVGRKQFVRPAEIDAAIAREASPDRASVSANVSHIVALLKGRS
jgi:hypothetical protein